MPSFEIDYRPRKFAIFLCREFPVQKAGFVQVQTIIPYSSAPSSFGKRKKE